MAQDGKSNISGVGGEALSTFQTALAWLVSNVISAAGVVIVTTATILWLLSLPAYWRVEHNPYIGILLFFALPGLFVFGLILIPIGIIIQRARRKARGETGIVLPKGVMLRRIATFVGLTTAANLVIGAQFTYKAVAYMETEQFCGQACHTPMQPEFEAWQRTPHAKVECVECHIGSGAEAFVKAKAAGTLQLINVVLNTFPRPLPHPVTNMRPALETCGNCHWPQKYIGNKLWVHQSYGDDEPNTPSTTLASLKIGGPTPLGRTGIHGAHLDPAIRIEFVPTSETREAVGSVFYTDANGKVTEYKDTTAKTAPASSARRTMDCIDCHNRPAHQQKTPERAVDEAMAKGLIATDLPLIHKKAVEVLKKDYKDDDTAVKEISSALRQFYQSSYPQISVSHVDETVGAVVDIYKGNVFPAMKVTWGTYPSHIGHTDSPGCFRCHDGNHTSAQGKTISNDCSACHDLLATEEKNPKILSDLGWAPPAPAPASK